MAHRKTHEMGQGRRCYMVLDEEIALFKQGTHTAVLPAPHPVYISHATLRPYIDRIYASTKHEIYKLSDNSGAVTEMLMRKVIELTYKPDPYVIKTLYHIMKKIGIYDYYLRHPKYFSLTYHAIRKFLLFFMPGKGKDKVSS